MCQGYGVGDGECVGDCDRECARMNVWYGQKTPMHKLMYMGVSHFDLTKNQNIIGINCAYNSTKRPLAGISVEKSINLGIIVTPLSVLTFSYWIR